MKVAFSLSNLLIYRFLLKNLIANRISSRTVRLLKAIEKRSRSERENFAQIEYINTLYALCIRLFLFLHISLSRYIFFSFYFFIYLFRKHRRSKLREARHRGTSLSRSFPPPKRHPVVDKTYTSIHLCIPQYLYSHILYMPGDSIPLFTTPGELSAKFRLGWRGKKNKKTFTNYVNWPFGSIRGARLCETYLGKRGEPCNGRMVTRIAPLPANNINTRPNSFRIRTKSIAVHIHLLHARFLKEIKISGIKQTFHFG